MKTLLTESDLLAAMPARQLADIRAQAPAGEDPVVVVMIQACATVDGYVGNRDIPAALASKLARDLAVYDLAKLLDKPTDAQKTAYENALKALDDVRSGRFAGSSGGDGAGNMGWGSNRKIR
ncbi:phage protein Gp36 family protein [Akkermansia muciniphila]|uniref:phage protein Gp36 family protein n=1 Tax=Akkermansia muciniphila TaxID=239935 RepID=UPI000B8E540B|nr:phage protein Gp36 family protein [Akkermansia muciniphila]